MNAEIRAGLRRLDALLARIAREIENLEEAERLKDDN